MATAIPTDAKRYLKIRANSVELRPTNITLLGSRQFSKNANITEFMIPQLSALYWRHLSQGFQVLQQSLLEDRRCR
jgi:hypothetical protein